MKKINTFIAIWLLLMPFTACEDFLKEEPYSLITTDNFYKTEADAQAGVNAVYTILNDGSYYGNYMWYFGDVSADQANNGEVTGGLDAMEYNPAIDRFRNFWTTMYRGINYANNVLAFVPPMSIEDDQKSRYLAEVSFFRAMFYFDLVRAFGGVPKITEPTLDESNNELPRATAEEIYELIIADLQQAEADLPASYGGGDTGRPTQGAAKALLAKVYLTMGDWPNARDKAQEVIQSGAYELFEDYRDVFGIENENGKEHIFSVQFMAEGTSGLGSSFTSAFASRNPNLLFGGLRAGAGIAAENDFYNDFPDHYRKHITMIDSFPTPYYPEITAEGIAQAGPACMKYWDPNLIAESRGDANWIVLRYSDVLLMFAEAENEVNGPTPAAYDAINQVRQRARDANADGIDDPEELAALPDLTGLSKDEFREAVWYERGMELCFEGHRRWDLVRTGRFIQVMQAHGKPAEPRHTLFPIPLLEIQANPNLAQNTGYAGE